MCKFAKSKARIKGASRMKFERLENILTETQCELMRQEELLKGRWISIALLENYAAANFRMRDAVFVTPAVRVLSLVLSSPDVRIKTRMSFIVTSNRWLKAHR